MQAPPCDEVGECRRNVSAAISERKGLSAFFVKVFAGTPQNTVDAASIEILELELALHVSIDPKPSLHVWLLEAGLWLASPLIDAGIQHGMARRGEGQA